MSDRHLRNLQADYDATSGRAGSVPPDSTASFLGQVAVETTLPTATPRVYMVNPVEVDGGQDEGDAPTFTADEDRLVPVVVLGDPSPALGDYLEVSWAGGRWVAETGCGSEPDCPEGGTLCVTLTPICSGNGNGYSVVVKPHGSATVVATGTTSSNTVCFNLPPGFYDVTATKSTCVSFSWPNQEVTCGGTTTLGGNAMCGPGAAIVFTVFGCGYAQPGVVITITGADSGTTTTGSDGKATFYSTHTGTFSYSAVHPSGRYKTATGSLSKSFLCTGGTVFITMVPEDGYVCCAATAYPIKSTLHLTIGDGAHVVTLTNQVVTTNNPVSPTLIGTNCSGNTPLDILVGVGCDISNGIVLTLTWREISGSSPCFFSAAYVQNGASVPGAVGSSVRGFATPPPAPPFAVSGTVAPVIPFASTLGDPTGTSTWTLSE